MRTDELDFNLPPELIAQVPLKSRESSRLLRYRRADRSVSHNTFGELPVLLREGDLLVLNDTRVLPARFALRKPTGGRIEGLFLSEARPGFWNVMLKNLAGYVGLLHLEHAPDIFATVTRAGEGGEYELQVLTPEPAAAVLSRIGRMPLPPYIKRDKGGDERDDLDRSRYQTVFARVPGAVAAPTASLHFSERLLKTLDAINIRRTFVTLEVGMGTFKPVTVETLEDHVMHAEPYTIGPEAAESLNLARSEGGRIIAVGTTTARVLESQPAGAPFAAKSATTDIFIRPPYCWKHVDALITNFHLPRSTLIALVAAMTGLEEQRRLYQIAISERYRFFSYGDSMFIS